METGNGKKIMANFGKNLRKLRKASKITQKQLAEKSKLHFTYISSIEKGERNLSLLNIHKLSKALGCSVKELIE